MIALIKLNQFLKLHYRLPHACLLDQNSCLRNKSELSAQASTKRLSRIKGPEAKTDKPVILVFRQHNVEKPFSIESLATENSSVKSSESNDDMTDSSNQINDAEETSPSKVSKSVTELMWLPIPSNQPFVSIWRQQLDIWAKLSKLRLSGFVVSTALAGYMLAPGTWEPLSLGACLLGTALTSASANTVNQILEVPYDSQMNRTKNRPLVRESVTLSHAALFGVNTGMAGLLLLYYGVNPLTAALGATNLLLYTAVYTPLKRVSISNTWLGSLVGAIPPMMGWTAVSGSLNPGAFILGAILCSWQFPHFMALSWNLRGDYSRAGYRMASVVDPGMCTRVSLRHSLAIIPLCTLLSYFNVTSWLFALESLPVNLYLVYLAFEFYRKKDSNSSRKLFRYTLIHLPLLIVLMIFNKTWSTSVD